MRSTKYIFLQIPNVQGLQPDEIKSVNDVLRMYRDGLIHSYLYTLDEPQEKLGWTTIRLETLCSEPSTELDTTDTEQQS